MGASMSSLNVEYPSQSQLDVDEPSAIQTSEPVSIAEDNRALIVCFLNWWTNPFCTVIPDESGIEQSKESIKLLCSTRPTQSAQEDGELDRSFKFGGQPKNPPNHELMLSDIIPPPEFVRAISKAPMLDDIEDDSFAGFDNFDEVCRGFEFSGDCSFDSPQHANRHGIRHREESAFSIALVPTYGQVLTNNITVSDPFE